MNFTEILAFVFLILWSAFFSWTELALMNIPFHKINALIKKWNKTALILKKLKNNSDRLLITILIWNNIVNITAASLATKISIDIANNSWLEKGLAIWISTGIVTFLILLFWEIFPKSLALKYSERISLLTSHIYYILQKLLYPIVWIVESLTKLLKNKKPNQITEEEIESFIEIWNKQWIFEKWEYEKIRNMLDFYEISAEETMVPRVKIEALDYNLTLKQALNKVLEFSHSRIPIYQDNIDNINRFISIRELFQLQRDPNNLDKKLKDLAKNEIAKVFITTPIHTILDIFKTSRKHITIVQDEFGGVAWLITLEDIIEEVFGDIMDEADKEPIPIRETNNWLLIQWDVIFEDVIYKLWLDLWHIKISQEYLNETISYVFISHIKWLPKLWQTIKISIENIEETNTQTINIKINKIDKNIIKEVEVYIR